MPHDDYPIEEALAPQFANSIDFGEDELGEITMSEEYALTPSGALVSKIEDLLREALEEATTAEDVMLEAHETARRATEEFNRWHVQTQRLNAARRTLAGDSAPFSNTAAALKAAREKIRADRAAAAEIEPKWDQR